MKLVIPDKQVLGLQLFLHPSLDPELQVAVESIQGGHGKVLDNVECRLVISLHENLAVSVSLPSGIYELKEHLEISLRHQMD